MTEQVLTFHLKLIMTLNPSHFLYKSTSFSLLFICILICNFFVFIFLLFVINEIFFSFKFYKQHLLNCIQELLFDKISQTVLSHQQQSGIVYI